MTCRTWRIQKQEEVIEVAKGRLIKVFPGGNTALGFYSFYDHIIEPDAARIFVIKGGPGVGKSTFMRYIGEAMLKGVTMWSFTVARRITVRWTESLYRPSVWPCLTAQARISLIQRIRVLWTRLSTWGDYWNERKESGKTKRKSSLLTKNWAAFLDTPTLISQRQSYSLMR